MSLLVVLPFFSGDEHLLLNNLAWMKELDGRLDYDCLLAFDDQTNPSRAQSAAQGLFRSVTSLKYKRPQHSHWPFPQNNAFLNVAWHVEAKHKGPWFWCETDAIPIKRKWLDTLWAEYQRGGKPFGGHWNQFTGVFNGVAFYPSNISKYSQMMMMAPLVSATDKSGKPYQPPWDYYGSKDVRPHLHVMNDLMQHRWDFDGIPITFPDQAFVAQMVRDGVVLFHRCKDTTLVQRLRETSDAPSATCAPETPHPKTEIFIVSYFKDSEWLKVCLSSISKFCTGFLGVTVAFPQQDSAVLGQICKDYGAKRVMFKEDRTRGHLHHMVIKCMADKYCPSADFILHTDSDCLFKEPVTPSDYFNKGKPVLLRESFEHIKASGYNLGRLNWQQPTQDAIGYNVSHETMCRHPAVHHRTLYAMLRGRIEAIHSKSFHDYVMGVRPTFPFGFCEFAALGALAWEQCRDDYSWIEVGVDDVPKSKLVQCWSHGGFNHLLNGRQQGTIITDILQI